MTDPEKQSRKRGRTTHSNILQNMLPKNAFFVLHPNIRAAISTSSAPIAQLVEQLICNQ
jgi:hypothetical protein